LFQYDSVYGIANGVDNTRYNNYGFESGGRGNPSNPVAAVNTNLAGTAGLYHPQNGPRYGLGLPPRGNSGADGKMNGLHGPKHKRGDMDRECLLIFRFTKTSINVLTQSTDLRALALKTFKERSLLCAKINTGVGTCKKNWKRASQSIVI